MNEVAESGIKQHHRGGASQGEEELLGKLQEWLREAERSTPEMRWREEAEEDYDFYAGRQDKPEVRQALIAQKRPVTVYNEVKPRIDKLVGLAAQIRRTPKVFPVTKEDEPLAELINGVFKHFRYHTKASRREMECFEHAVKSGRSFLYFYVDTSNPFEPQIKCKRLPGRDVLVDPDCYDYDINEARYVFISRWFTEEEIRAYWDRFDADAIRMFDTDLSYYTPTYFNESKKLYRLVECWYKKPERAVWFVNPMTGRPEHLTRAQWRDFVKRLREGITLPDGRVWRGDPPTAVESVMQVPHYAIFSGNVLLEHGRSPYRWHGYPIVLFGGYKDENENRYMSAIEMMKDPQRALNTMRRQLSHLLQTAPKGILMHEIDAILNVDEYDKHSSEPNFRLVLNRGGLGRVKFSEQPQISPIYGQLDAQYRQSIVDVSGIQDVLMGKQTGTREPGVTARMRLESNIAVLYILFANFRDARLQGGELLLSLVQQYVTYPMVIRMEGAKGAQLVEINTQLNPQIEGFNDISAGKFDLRIDEEAEDVTMRREIANMLMEYAHNAPDAIPPEIILEYMDVPFTVKAQVQQYNEARIEREMMLRMAEIKAKEAKDGRRKANTARR